MKPTIYKNCINGLLYKINSAGYLMCKKTGEWNKSLYNFDCPLIFDSVEDLVSDKLASGMWIVQD